LQKVPKPEIRTQLNVITDDLAPQPGVQVGLLFDGTKLPAKRLLDVLSGGDEQEVVPKFNVVGASSAAYDDNEIMEKLEGLAQATPADGV
jgi:hypothetical protein